jgi:LemA protein
MVQDYNTYIRQFPQVITAKLFGYATKPNFTVENEAQISQPPAVKFGSQQPAPAPQPQPQAPQHPQPAN